MKRILLSTVLCAVAVLTIASVGSAQSAPVVEEDGSIRIASDVSTDCRLFAFNVDQGYDLGLTQEEIQSVLAQCEEVGDTEVQKVACSELGDSGEQARQEAIALLNQNASDPNGLDADGDGVPCEFTESSGQISYEDGSVIYDVLPNNVPQDTDTTEDPPAPTEPTSTEPTPTQVAPTEEPAPEVVETEVLPNTGGAPLLALGAGALLVAGGLLTRRIVK